MNRSGHLWYVSRPFALGTSLFAAIGVLAGCLGSHTSVSNTPGEVPVPPPEVTLPVPQAITVSSDKAAEYVSEESCGTCHPDAAKDHARTPHADTFRPVSLKRDGPNFRAGKPIRDELTGGVFRTLVQGTDLVIAGRQGANSASSKVTHAIGSGTAGITYIEVNAQGMCLMPRIQMYRQKGKPLWDWTPGSQPGTPRNTPLGTVIPSDALPECLACHSTVLSISAAKVEYAKSIFNVGCQRCHGPAREHLRQVNQKPAEKGNALSTIGMPRLSSLKAEQVTMLCETCHRGLSPIPKDEVPPTLARLQGRALKMSACFQKGDVEKLSCVNCHQPHSPKETAAAPYERTCKGCHRQAEPAVRLCKVNPNKGCVGCHMGKEVLTVFGKSTYTNHWIRKRPESIFRDSPQGNGPM